MLDGILAQMQLWPIYKTYIPGLCDDVLSEKCLEPHLELKMKSTELFFMNIIKVYKKYYKFWILFHE